MKRYIVMLNCGCCDEVVEFETAQRAQDAILMMGLTSSGTLTDDNGRVVTQVDSFYGIHEEDEFNKMKNDKGQLGILIDQLKNLSE